MKSDLYDIYDNLMDKTTDFAMKLKAWLETKTRFKGLSE